jgi:putative ABC transport system permease protein
MIQPWLTQAIRLFWRDSSIVVVVLLALGIGSAVAIFSIINTVLLQPPSYMDGLVAVEAREPSDTGPGGASYADFQDWKARSHSFTNMVVISGAFETLRGVASPEYLEGLEVSPDFAPLLKLKPILGRTFLDSEFKSGNDRVVMISERVWRTHFHGDTDILGGTIRLGNDLLTVVGVSPSNLHLFWNENSFLRPLVLDARSVQDRGSRPFFVIARLNSGVTSQQALLEMNTIASELKVRYPATNTDRKIVVTSLVEMEVGNVRPLLLLLMGAVGFVLLITCADVAGILLVRGTTRYKEFAIRSALGASRLSLAFRSALACVVPALVGAAIGLAVAGLGIAYLTKLLPTQIDYVSVARIGQVTIDWRVFLFTLFVTLVATVISGIVPTIQAATPRLHELLNRSAEARYHHRVGQTLICVELAIAFVLMTGAGLMTYSFERMLHEHVEFEPSNLFEIQMLTLEFATAGEQLRAFKDKGMTALQSIPGITAVAASELCPVGGFSLITPAPAGDGSPGKRTVSSEYFRTMRSSALRGRLLGDGDIRGAPKVVVINEAAAQKLQLGGDSVGKYVNFGSAREPDLREVVGVVASTRRFGITGPTTAEILVPYAQNDVNSNEFPGVCFIARTASNPINVIGAARAAIQRLAPESPIRDARTVEDLIDQAMAPRRFSMLLISVFALISIALAAAGVYGVSAYSVSQRRKEFGVRIAIGASPNDLVGLVLRQTVRPILVGISFGLAAAFSLSRFLENQLYGISPHNIPTYIGVLGFLVLLSVLAVYVPARAIASRDPLSALRRE